MRDTSPNLRTASTLAPADLRKAWETTARVRFVRSRRALGLSQGGAASLIHASVDAVERWESGRCRVPAWALVAVEDRLRARDDLRGVLTPVVQLTPAPVKEAA